MAWFDEARLDDEAALAASDATLRGLAESGARLRRAVTEAGEDAAVARALGGEPERPRAVVLLGPSSSLVRAVLEPVAGVPVTDWRHEALPGWLGGLDLVVILAPRGIPDARLAAQAAGAVRRGCRVLTCAPADSPVAEHAAGRSSTVLGTEADEPGVVALVVLAHLAAVGLAPAFEVEDVAAALDDVAVACSPYRGSDGNPGKLAAVGLAESLPVLGATGPDPLAAHTVEQAALRLRRITGLAVVHGAAPDLVPVLAAAPPRSVFADPYQDADQGPRPSLLLLSGPGPQDADGADRADSTGSGLREAAEAAGVRVVELDAPDTGPLAVHAAQVLGAAYAGAYLRLGSVDGPR